MRRAIVIERACFGKDTADRVCEKPDATRLAGAEAIQRARIERRLAARPQSLPLRPENVEDDNLLVG